MATFDHFVFACNDLTWGGAFISTLTGVNPARGGSHPGVGTHNSLMSLGDETYLEIIARDPDQPQPQQPRPFGIDVLDAPQLATFAIHADAGESIDDIVAAMAEAGFDPGPVTKMQRQTPDGSTLSWQLTRRPAGPIPFVIDWGNSPNPATSTPSGCTLAGVRCTWPDPPQLRDLYAQLGFEANVMKGAPSVSITIASREGDVELR